MAPRARITGFVVGGRRINVNSDLRTAGTTVSRQVNFGVFDAVRNELGIRQVRQGSVIRADNSSLGRALRRGIDAVTEAISETGTFRALTSDSRLSREIGLTRTDRFNKTQAMLGFISRSIVIRFRSVSVSPTASRQSLQFEVLVPNEETILNNPFATYQYAGQGPTNKGQTVVIPWLSWLLTQGGRIVTPGHAPRPGEPSRSRQNTIMNSRNIAGVGWAVPVSHQGEPERNFVTRGIDRGLPRLRESLRSEIRNAIGRAN